MQITISSSFDAEHSCSVTEPSPETATDACHLVYKAMLGMGYQPESILGGMEAVLEEYSNNNKEQ